MVIPSGPLAAIACIRGEGQLRGTVKFYPTNCATLVYADVEGLPDNGTDFFAMHIHEGNNCAGTEYCETGGHYNPDAQRHPLHAGDLPPLLSEHGRALLAVETSRFNVWEIVGRTVVIHSGRDDFSSQPGGGAGRKLACGVIRKC
ncbi:MAG: superoxide dismutase family protein [Oscillospiraceae bacterium]|nr:superoxide dismutase family protein [Oscillospiraceae bacterium]